MTRTVRGLSLEAEEGLIEVGCSDGVITDLIAIEGEPSDSEPFLAAGFVDLQVNGGWGKDFTEDPTGIWEVGSRLVGHGVTSFLPTIVSAPYEVTETAMEVLRAGPPADYAGARALGLHIEGPWLSPEWSGAHDGGHLALPDVDTSRKWAESGLVAMVTIAPELPGAFEVARILSEAGVVVAMGHTGATYAQAIEALKRGFTAATHLYNQMTPLHHRSPGVVGAVMDARPFTGLIADGLHCHPGAARLAWRVLGPDRLFLVSDSMAATGLANGTYRLGETEVIVGEEGSRTVDGRLAGSVLTLDRALRNLAGWVESQPAELLASVSTIPAAALRRNDIGTVDVGHHADLVVVSRELEILATYVSGNLLFHSDG